MLSSRVFRRAAALAAACLGIIVTAPARADEVLRILAANISSGTNQAYEDPGNRILRGLDPDIALLQEMEVGSKSAAEYRAWVNTNFGTTFAYYVESTKNIPNGIVSRYPILSSGSWNDPDLDDREFAWAKIDIPGDKHLWAVSIHLKASDGSTNENRRNNQAVALVNFINSNVTAGDFLVIGGDCNTYSRTEPCIQTLASVVKTTAPWPADQAGNTNTNSGQSSPYDWVMPSTNLAAYATPLVIGSNTHTNGLVFDSRDYTPLSAVSPVQQGDSGVEGMQHMAVVRAFLIPTNDPPVIAQGDPVSVTLSKNNTPTAFSRSLSASDPENNALTWSIQTQAGHGTAGIVSPGTGGTVNLSYTPVTNYTGTDSFVVRVSDGLGGTDSITVNLTIQEPPNTAPVITQGTAVSVTLSKNNTPTAFSRSLNATDGNGDSLAWTISTPAAHGTAGIVAPASGGTVALSYTPATNYTGSDSFIARVSDGRGGSDTVLVQVTVENSSAFDAWTHAAFAPLNAGTEATVWGKDADPDGDGFSNLEEFAHGLNPELSDGAPNLVKLVYAGEGQQREVTLTLKLRMDGSSTALDYVLQSSDLVGAWSEVIPVDYTLIGETDLGGGFIARTLRLTPGADEGIRCFRLVFTAPE